jgi:hypothetical protein
MKMTFRRETPMRTIVIAAALLMFATIGSAQTPEPPPTSKWVTASQAVFVASQITAIDAQRRSTVDGPLSLKEAIGLRSFLGDNVRDVGDRSRTLGAQLSRVVQCADREVTELSAPIGNTEKQAAGSAGVPDPARLVF